MSQSSRYAEHPANPVDSWAPTQAKVQFRDLKSADNGVSITTSDYLQEISISMRQKDCSWTGSMTLFDADGSFLEGLALAEKRYVSFSFGWDNPGYVAPTYSGYITGYTPTFGVDGIHLVLNMVSTTVPDSVLDKATPPHSFPKGMTASAIFQQIAWKRGWKTTDKYGNSTIELSADPLPVEMAYVSNGGSYESDLSFILNKLCNYARSADKEPYVFYFDADGAAHFKSLPRAGTGAADTISKSYVFNGDAMGDVMSFSPSDNVLGALLLGGGNALFLGPNSKDGTSLSASSDALRGIAPVGVDPKTQQPYLRVVGDGVARSVLGGDGAEKYVNCQINLNARSKEELEILSSNHWAWASQFSYLAEMSVRGTHEVNIYDLIRVRYVKKDGKDHQMSGVFQVHGVSHSFNSSGWHTNFNLWRRGMRYEHYEAQQTVERMALKENAAAKEAKEKAAVAKEAVQTTLIKSADAASRVKF